LINKPELKSLVVIVPFLKVCHLCVSALFAAGAATGVATGFVATVFHPGQPHRLPPQQTSAVSFNKFDHACTIKKQQLLKGSDQTHFCILKSHNAAVAVCRVSFNQSPFKRRKNAHT